MVIQRLTDDKVLIRGVRSRSVSCRLGERTPQAIYEVTNMAVLQEVLLANEPIPDHVARRVGPTAFGWNYFPGRLCTFGFKEPSEPVFLITF